MCELILQPFPAKKYSCQFNSILWSQNIFRSRFKFAFFPPLSEKLMLIDIDCCWLILIDVDAAAGCWFVLMLIDSDWLCLILVDADADWVWWMLVDAQIRLTRFSFVAAHFQSFSGHFRLGYDHKICPKTHLVNFLMAHFIAPQCTG